MGCLLISANQQGIAIDLYSVRGKGVYVGSVRGEAVYVGRQCTWGGSVRGKGVYVGRSVLGPEQLVELVD